MAADDGAHVAATSLGAGDLERWWPRVVEASPDGVLVVDGHAIAYANRAMEQLAGVAEGALAGRSVETLLPVEQRSRHRRLRRAFARSPRTRPMGSGADLAMLTADGSVLPVEVALAPLSTEGRHLTLATVRDVSARRADQVERARMAHILQIVPDAVIVVDATTGLVVDVNPAAGMLLGCSPNALRGTPAATLATDGDPDFLRRSSTELRVERIRTPQGDIVECEVHAAAFDATGRTEVANVVRDVGERLQLERRARANELTLRTVFEQAPVGLAVTRLDARGVRTIVQTNDAFARIFGYGPHELDGKEPSVLTAPGARLPGPTASGLGDETSLVGSTVTRQYVSRDGSPMWAEVRATQLALDDEEARLFLVNAFDVTDRVEADRVREQQGVVSECIADVANAALAHEDASRVFDLVARGALAAMDADGVVVLVSVPERAGRKVAAVSGPLGTSLAEDVERTTRTRPADAVHGEARVPGVGPVIAVPFGPEESLPSGQVVACRAPGRPPFSRAESAELARLAAQTQVALHLAQARDAQQRLVLIEERQRIARDLHDTVIQDMIALGMEMSAEASTSSEPRQRARDVDHLARLEDMVVSLRRAVFQLRDTTAGRSMAREVTDAVAHASRMLLTPPTVTFAGPLELVSAEVLDDLIAVLREALSNVARHAGATRVAVSLTVTDTDVVLVVDDDGVGLTDESTSGFGVLSFTERARRHGGVVSLGPGPVVGTTMTWRCPLARD